MECAENFFGRRRITLYHGSPQIVRHPRYGGGNPHNDYGPGFYATELQELALEWACPQADDGWANEYVMDVRDLCVLDLSSERYTVLNWMAVLLEHRKVSTGIGIAEEARSFIIERYGTSLEGADIVHGYRADDSYFHIARSFLNNRIPVEVLERSLFLGGLGHQVALVSEKAFGCLTWVAAERAAGATWNPRRIKRDATARAVAVRLEREALDARTGTYVLDLMRGAGTWQR